VDAGHDSLQTITMKRITSGTAGPAQPDPAPAATASADTRARLGDMPGRPQPRRSSAPPAPRTADFNALPLDVLPSIVTQLAQRSPAEAARDIAHTAAVNKALQSAVATNQHATRCMDRVPNVRHLIEHLLSGSPDPNPRDARLCVPVLGLLSRREQAMLVRVLTSPAAHGMYHWTRHDDPFSELVPHLAELDPPLRATLVEQAIRNELAEPAAAQAIARLGRALAHLDPPLIDQLLNRATGLHTELARASAIRGLCSGLGRMNQVQREQLWRAAMALPTCRFIALRGLRAQLEHLLPEQRQQVFMQATSAGLEPWQQAQALSGLAASMEVLDQEQRQALITLGYSLPDEDGSRGEAVCALAAGVKHLQPGQRSQLVTEILGLGSAMDRSRAIAQLGAQLGHLAAGQQAELLQAAAAWRVDAKAKAVTGFAAGLQHMDPEHRRTLVTLVLGMDVDSCMAEAIGALGPQLKHLDRDLRDALVEQALRLLGHEACRNPNCRAQVRTLSAGLGAGMEALREDQHAALVAAAMDPRSLRTASHLPAVAAAIAGLSAGLRHLSKDSIAALQQAATSLEVALRSAEATGRLPRSQCTQAHTTAVFALVRA